MNWLNRPTTRLTALLWLVALHSFAVGIGLLVQPSILFNTFSFPQHYGYFFPAQGGVFHLIMAVAYATAAVDSWKFYYFIPFAVFVKSAATLFLFTYYFLFEQSWIILLSGLGDGLMMVLLLICWKAYTKSQGIPGRDQ